MWFKKPKAKNEASRFPGRLTAIDGQAAAFETESLVSDILVVQSSSDLSETATTVHSPAPADTKEKSRQATVAHLSDPAGVCARVTGASASGARAAAMIAGSSSVRASLFAAAGKRLTSVYHLACHAPARQASALGGSHDDYYDLAGAGLFQLFARGAQEAADHVIIAHRVAERSLTPGLCAQDLFRTSHSVQAVALPEAELVAEYLGDSGDEVDTPTPAQKFLFGNRRRRVPRVIDGDHPAGIGGSQDQESYFKALAAQRTYFADHLPGILEEAMEEFADLTRRRYQPAAGYRVDDADVVVLAQGAVLDELEAVVDALRKNEKIKAGVINLAVFRPFPGAALSRLLRGKKAVTVLERTDRPLAETLPMTAEVRAAIDRAAENGLGPQPLHEGYDAYGQGDRPRVFTGIYGAGAELPAFEDLVAVVRNMFAGAPRASFYVGMGNEESLRRFPHLQTLQQALGRDYPGRNDAMLPPAADATGPESPGHSVQLYSLSLQGGLFAGNLFAQLLAEEAGHSVHTFPGGGLEPGLQPTTFAFLHAKNDAVARSRPATFETVLLSGGKLIEDVSSHAAVKAGGTLIVESNLDGQALWNVLTRRSARWIQDQGLRIHVIDAGRVVAEAASRASFADQLAVWALLGAYATTTLGGDDLSAVIGGLRVRLSRLLGSGHYLIEDIASAFRRGSEELHELDWKSYGTDELRAVNDGETPWTLKNVREWDDTLFDVTRFWHSVGYLYDSGQAHRALADPYLATGVIPARSSAFRDMSSYRLRMPEWLPENCTGCGLCWAQCPDSALPPAVQGIPALIDAGMSLAESDGPALVQMKRFAGHLGKQAYRLLVGDGMHRYGDMGTLLGDAFEQLVDKLGLDDGKRLALEEEFKRTRERIASYPVAKTECFFDEPHGAEKGAGLLLSITLNPLSCTGCGICTEVCADAAFDWTEQTPARLETIRANWDIQMMLPAPSPGIIERHVDEQKPETLVNRLLDPAVYHSLVGGDGSYPGNSAKTALHLVTAAVESVMKPRFEAYTSRVSEVIDGLERRIQGDVSGVLKINDFDQFSRKLDRLGDSELTPDALASTLHEESSATIIDHDRLKRLTGLLAELKTQKQLYESGGDGSGRARMTMAIDAASGTLLNGTYPYNPLPYPWVCHTTGDGVELATGIYEAVAMRMADEFVLRRTAELEIDDRFDPEKHDPFFASFDTHGFTDEEAALMPPVLVLLESNAVDWHQISTVLAGRVPLKFVLINSEGASVDEHGTITPLESGIVTLARSHPGSFVAQTTTGHPGHLIQRSAQGVAHDGPALLHVFAPDPYRAGVAPAKIAEQARLGYESRMFPLFSSLDAVIALDGNPDPGATWAMGQLTFREPSGAESSVDAPVTVADWAVHEARFQQCFTIVPRGQAGDQLKPLHEYLELDAAARESVEPYVHFADDQQRHFLAIVSPEMVQVTERCRDFWIGLQGSHAGGVESVATLSDEKPAAVPTPAESSAPVDADVHSSITDRLLQLSGFKADPEFFRQALAEFVVKRNLESTQGEEHGDASPSHSVE